MMTSSEAAEEYITLKYANHFVKKDITHLINIDEWCSRNTQPLMITYFDRIRVNITVSSFFDALTWMYSFKGKYESDNIERMSQN